MGRRRDRRRSFLRCLLYFFFSLTIILIYVWQRNELLRIGYDIREREKENLEFIEEKKVLELELSNLRSPQRIEAISKDKLGLTSPSLSQFFEIKVPKEESD